MLFCILLFCNLQNNWHSAEYWVSVVLYCITTMQTMCSSMAFMRHHPRDVPSNFRSRAYYFLTRYAVHPNLCKHVTRDSSLIRRESPTRTVGNLGTVCRLTTFGRSLESTFLRLDGPPTGTPPPHAPFSIPTVLYLSTSMNWETIINAAKRK